MSSRICLFVEHNILDNNHLASNKVILEQQQNKDAFKRFFIKFTKLIGISQSKDITTKNS